MSSKKRLSYANLLATRARLVALYPFVSGEMGRRLLHTIQKIDAKLGVSHRVDVRKLVEADDAAAGIRGVGGLEFSVAAPPGRGRLVRIPMFLVQTPGTRVISGGTAGGMSTTNPVCIAQLNTTASVLTGIRMQTQMVTWASYRVVGFQCLQLGTTTTTLDAVHSAVARPFLLCKSLVPGGGNNLFPHEGYIDAAVYDCSIPEFSGLRDDPVIERTNQVTVDLAVTGVGQGTANNPQRITFAAWLVGEIVEDDDVGAPIPGPYVRGDALLRRRISPLGRQEAR